MATGNRTTPKGDAYKPSTVRSGYSRKDDKAAKDYGKLDYKDSKGSPLPESERKYRRDKGAPLSYYANERSKEGREINQKNTKFLKDEVKAKESPTAKRLKGKAI